MINQAIWRFNNSPRITLTESEMQIASMIGNQRQIQNLIAGRQDAHGLKEDLGWNFHIEGCGGEMGFAKWGNRYWSGNVGDLAADDVGKVQVRTRSRDSYELYCHKSDRDDRIFTLLTGKMPQYWVRGWLWGWEVKRYGKWDTHQPGRYSFFVETKLLHPMDQSPDLMDQSPETKPALRIVASQA